MIDHLCSFLPNSTLRKLCLLLPMVGILSQLAAQQEDADSAIPPPPNFTPPGLPPDWSPPAPPDGFPGFPDLTNTPAQSESASPLVDESDPAMAETVGLIRIPEMGTNEVLEMLENFTGKPILRHNSLPAVTITFFSQEPLTRGEAIMAIESLLSLNGIAITPLGDKFLKAVPATIMNAQGAPVWEGGSLDAEPTQKIYEKLFNLNFLTPTEAQALIRPLLSTTNEPLAFEKSGILIVTDALINLQRIERLLSRIDQPATVKTEILFYELQNISSADALRRLQEMQTGPLKNQLENNTSFSADERTNQLIVFTHPSNRSLIDNLVERLDIDVAPLTATEVFSIRYADATEVVTIIEQIITGQREVRTETGGDTNPNARAANARRVQQVRTNNAAVAAARSEASNLQFSDFLTIVPDERANTIVASGTHNDLRYLQQLIDEIDTLLAQVRIEVVIAEVRLGENQSRGIDSFGFSYNSASGGGGGTPTFNIDDGTNNVDQKYATPGSFYGVSIPGVTWGPDGFGIQAVLNAAKTESNVTVLSAPTIVTTHNKEATVSVGEERPVITGVTSSTSGDNIVTQDQVQFKDIKLELKVTPLIGSNGVVQLEIDQQIQSVVGTVSVNGNDQPIVGTRQANSYVSVADNELIVLGGLQSLDFTDSRGRMAIFGSIPVIGDLFSSKSTDYIRNELLIFMRPTIIFSTDEANFDAQKQILNREDSERILDYLNTGSFSDPEKEVPEKDAPPPRRFGN